MKLSLFVFGVFSLLLCSINLTQGWKCKECLDYKGQPDYLSFSKLSQLLESACGDNATAISLFNHFLHNCYLEYPGLVPAHFQVDVIDTSEYCAQIRHEANMKEALVGGELCSPGLTHVNTTYEILHRVCFSKGIGLREGCKTYEKKIFVPECENEENRNPGAWETIYISPDDHNLKEAIPFMKSSIWLCAEDECYKGRGTNVVCKSGEM